MVLYKKVADKDGEKRIQLAPEEEKAMLDKWESNRIKKEKKLENYQLKNLKKEDIRKKIQAVLELPDGDMFLLKEMLN